MTAQSFFVSANYLSTATVLYKRGTQLNGTAPLYLYGYGSYGISMDADANRIPESLSGLFAFLENEGPKHGIDPTRLGVYAASANTSQSIPYLMSDRAAKGIRAAALYYGVSPTAETPMTPLASVGIEPP